MEEKDKLSKGFMSVLPQLLIMLMVFLLPMFFVPVTMLDFLSMKSALFLGIFLLSIFVWTIENLKENQIKIPFNFVSLSMVLLMASYLLAGIFSSNFNLSFFGRDLGYDSVMVFLFLILFMWFVSTIFQNKKHASNLMVAIFGSILLVTIFHLIRLPFFAQFPTLNFFFEPSSNTVGRWFDLGIFAGIGVIVSILTLEIFKLSKLPKTLFSFLLSVNLFFLFLIGSSSLWLVIGIFALVFFVYFYAMHKTEKTSQGETGMRRIPTGSLITFLISVFFVLSGSFLGPLNQIREGLFNVSYLEVGPSMNSTFSIMVESIKNNPLSGAGPATYEVAWSQYKPEGFNLTNLWNIDFRYGSSLILSYITMSSYWGVLAWVFFLTIFLFYGFKSIFKPVVDQVSKYILVSSFLVSLFLWVMNLLYVPSFVNLVLTFLFTGAFFGSLYREKIIKVKTIEISDKPLYNFFYIFSLVFMLLVILLSGWHVTGRVYALSNYRQSTFALAGGDLETSEIKIINALNFQLTDTYFKLLSDIGLNKLAVIINDSPNLSDENQINAFRSILSTTIQSAQEAVRYAPGNYNNYISLGEIYENLVGLEVQGAYESAKSAYENAQQLSPRNPEIPLRLARLEFQQGNNDEARNYIVESLNIKGNYTDAVFLLSQIDVSEGNIERAISNVEQTTLVRPNDSLVYFQLGILRYQNDDFQGASSAFANALGINPAFDNARYFYGLSLDRSDNTDEAIRQFEILLQRYPDNQEIVFILDNLRRGLSPFSGISTEPQTPEEITEDPENREELPIEEELPSEEFESQ